MRLSRRLTIESRRKEGDGLQRYEKGNNMYKYIWGGVITWGIFITFFGLGAMNPVRAAAPDQEVLFLLAAGLVTCFIGLVGLVAAMSRIPAFTGSSSRVAYLPA
jgi:hypothetical protein